MSYNIVPYAVDAQALQRALLPGDPALLRRVEAAQAQLDAVYRNEPAVRALAALLDGAPAGQPAHALWYAVELACGELGTPITEPGSTLPACIQLSLDGIAAAPILEQLVLGTALALPLPPPADFPLHGVFELQRIRELSDELEAPADPAAWARLPAWLAWPAELSWERRTFVHWIRSCAAAGRDLVVFYY